MNITCFGLNCALPEDLIASPDCRRCRNLLLAKFLTPLLAHSSQPKAGAELIAERDHLTRLLNFPVCTEIRARLLGKGKDAEETSRWLPLSQLRWLAAHRQSKRALKAADGGETSVLCSRLHQYINFNCQSV